MSSKNKLQTTQHTRPPVSSVFAKMSEQITRSEGSPVDVSPATKRGLVHTTYQSFRIDLKQAPVPQRRYATDIASVVYDGYDVKIIFAQKDLFGDELESALSIRVNLGGFMEMSAQLSAFLPELGKIEGVLRLKVEGLTPIRSRPRVTANLVSNISSSAISGHETCMDFYQVNAFAMAKAGKSDKLEVEPVVRVEMRTSLFSALSKEVARIAAEIAAERDEEAPNE